MQISIQYLDYCSAIVVGLKNGALNLYGPTSNAALNGFYLLSTSVNGKPSWINGDYAIWFKTQYWIIGQVSARGSVYGYLYASNDITELTANENHWHYWTGYAWKLAPNDISVSCKGTFSNFSCM